MKKVMAIIMFIGLVTILAGCAPEIVTGKIVSIEYKMPTTWNHGATIVKFEDGSTYIFYQIIQGLAVGKCFTMTISNDGRAWNIKRVPCQQ